jgi:PAS domain S-box-containing protein
VPGTKEDTDADSMSGSLWVSENSDATKGEQRGAAEALRESSARFDVLLNLMPQMVWSTLPDGYHDFYNKRWYEYTGVPEGSTDGEGWNGMFHPDDQDRAWNIWRHSLDTGEPYEIEYRLRHKNGEYRWVLGRALPVRDTAGRVTRWIGTCTDIHEAKMDAEQNAILSRELSHRIKNIFAVINGLIGQSARSYPESKPYAQLLQSRVAALGQAHEFVRPHSDESRPEIGESSLLRMLARLFAAYPAFSEGRMIVEGDDIPIDDRGATPIALVPDGRIRVTSQLSEGYVSLNWIETGGPAVAHAPSRSGFGSRLVELSISGQLGGRLERDWRPDGLAVSIEIALPRLVR